MVAGNHEEWGNFSNYNARMRMPLYNKFTNHYYSFNMANIHFISINTHFYWTTNDITRREAFLRWFEEDLIEANQEYNREKRPWIVVMAHKPLYCSSQKAPDIPILRPFFQPFEDLFHLYNVDIFITGHVHYYER
jgi:hypothetical protein